MFTTVLFNYSLWTDSLPSHVPQVLINREPLRHLSFDVELLGDCDVIVNELCHHLGGHFSELCSTSSPAVEITTDDVASPADSTRVSDSSVSMIAANSASAPAVTENAADNADNVNLLGATVLSPVPGSTSTTTKYATDVIVRSSRLLAEARVDVADGAGTSSLTADVDNRFSANVEHDDAEEIPKMQPVNWASVLKRMHY